MMNTNKSVQSLSLWNELFGLIFFSLPSQYFIMYFFSLFFFYKKGHYNLKTIGYGTIRLDPIQNTFFQILLLFSLIQRSLSCSMFSRKHSKKTIVLVLILGVINLTKIGGHREKKRDMDMDMDMVGQLVKGFFVFSSFMIFSFLFFFPFIS